MASCRKDQDVIHDALRFSAQSPKADMSRERPSCASVREVHLFWADSFGRNSDERAIPRQVNGFRIAGCRAELPTTV
ncbi:unnamed protein product [Nesidiocoris tenuis]|uniref:Uncharacterized protein n=1 Tax=Nesidiocoris tenuis TaxID=355587 RepID=A0A6H5GXA3_9HEMI|nr:unnamed protein product [Nesidiocoris tenuis]